MESGGGRGRADDGGVGGISIWARPAAKTASNSKIHGTVEQAAEKMPCSVILSEAKNLSSI
jgi:hypothetical protein